MVFKKATVTAVGAAGEQVGRFRFNLTRDDIFGIIFRLTILSVTTYYGVRWLVKAMDPTRKQKQEAKQQVIFVSFLKFMFFQSNF